MAISKVLYSGKSDEWTTPPELFNKLDAEFNFTLDAAASDNNHLCKKYFTASDDALSRSWGGRSYFVTRHIARLKSGLKKHITSISSRKRQ